MENNKTLSEEEKVFNKLDSLYYFDGEVNFGSCEDSKVLTKDDLIDWYFEELKDDNEYLDVPFHEWVKHESSIWTLREWVINIKEFITVAEDSNDIGLLADLIYVLTRTQEKANGITIYMNSTSRMFYDWVKTVWEEHYETREKN